MQDDLNLTPEQQARLDALMARKAAQASQASSGDYQLNLTPEQQARLDTLMAKKAAEKKAAAMPYYQSVPRDIAQGLTQGATELLGNLQNITMPGVTLPKATQQVVAQAAQAAPSLGSGKNNLVSNLIRSSSSFVPYALGGEGVGADSLLSRMVVNAGAGGLSGYNEADENQQNLFGLVPKGKKGAALVNGLTNALIPGALEGLEAARPSQFLRGNISDEQLARNLESTKGTKTGIGDIVQNKFAKSILENILPSFAFTGADVAQQATQKQLQDSSKQLLNKLLGENNPTDIPGQIRNALNSSSQKARAIKNQKARALNDAADKSGMFVGRNNQQAFAQSKLDEINSDEELAASIPDEVKKDLQAHIDGYADQTLKGADISASKLDDKASKYYRQGDVYESGIYNELKKAKQKDIDETLDNATDENVKNLRDDFRDYYKTQYAPYLDPMIKKFTDYGEGDPDTIVQSFLKTTRVSDRGRLLHKLTLNLPEDSKNLVPYYYFSKSLNDDGSVNLNKWLSLSNSLGESQENSLFPDKNLQQEYNTLTHAIRINPAARNTMFNPSTGQMNRALLGAAGSLASGAKGAAIGSVGGPLGSVAGGILGLLAPSIAGKATTKLLTSEALRNSLVKEMLKNRKRFQGPKSNIASQSLVQGLMNMQGGQ